MQSIPRAFSKPNRHIHRIAIEVCVPKRRLDLERNLGMLSLKLGETGNHPARAERFQSAHTKRPLRIFAKPHLPCTQPTERGLDFPAVLPSRLCERESRVESFKESRPQMRLQSLDLTAQRRRRKMQLPRSLLKAQATGSGSKGDERTHRWEFFRHAEKYSSGMRDADGLPAES